MCAEQETEEGEKAKNQGKEDEGGGRREAGRNGWGSALRCYALKMWSIFICSSLFWACVVLA